MKKVTIQVALLSLSTSFTAMAIGLGDLTVHSSLNQPFDAEITLFDMGHIPLSMVRANLASSEEFSRLGLEMSNMVSALVFSVERNKAGVPVIHIRSDQRMNDPFMQILVDLAWGKGQTYRAYSLFLDPPNYQIVLNKGQPGIQFRRGSKHISSSTQNAVAGDESESTASSDASDESSLEGQAAHYGPTLAGESVWQIAERYRKDKLNLQQVVLGIVGINPHAFASDNLNGIKSGVRLNIPSTRQLMTVPSDAAKLEVLAHDSAWESKLPIQHVIEPPYMQPLGSARAMLPQTLDLPSILPKTPTFAAVLATTSTGSHYMPVPNVVMIQNDAKLASSSVTPLSVVPLDAKLRTEMDLAAAAIESVREANALLSEQFHQLQASNQALENKLKQRDQQMSKLQAQIHALTERQAVSAQTFKHADTNDSSTVPWLFVLVALLAGAGLVYRQYKWHNQSQPYMSDEQKPEPELTRVNQVASSLSSRRAAEVQIDIFEPNPPSLQTPEVTPEPIPEVTLEQIAETPAADVAPMPVDEDKKPDAVTEKPYSLELIEYVPTAIVPDKLETATVDLAIAVQAPVIEDEPPLDNGIEFNLEDEKDIAAVEIIPAEPSMAPHTKRPKPVKSTQAMDTLMALAKTYIVMGDMAAARESLSEVIRDAQGALQDEAKALLETLNQG